MKKFTFLKSLFLAVILAVGSNSAWAETIFSFTGTSGYAAPPAEGWTMEGTTAGGSYLKLDGGSVTSPVYQVYDNLVFSSDVATFGSGTAHPLVVEILKEGEVAQTFETKTPSKSDYIDGGNINIGNIDYPFQIRLSGETSRGVRVRNFTLTGDVPAVNFTITATSNDQGLGTVVVEGSTIKATLGQCATYAESAYTVTAGEANVTQEGDLFYVSATDDCTIQINFASIPNSTVILNAGSGSLEGESTFTQENCEAPITLPKAVVCETAAIAGWTFAGWSESEITETSQAPSLIPAGEYIPSSDITLYAVYQLGELDVFSVTLTKDNFGTNGYDANNGEHSIIATNEETVTIYTHQLMQQSSAIQWQKETAYLYNLTDFGGITKVVIDEYNDVNNLTVRESTAAGNDKGEIIEPTIEGKTYTYTMSGNNRVSFPWG